MWQGSAERSEAGVEAELPPERDSPAAQAGSDPQVSHAIDATIHSHRDGPPALLVGEEMATPLRGGTTSSNPLSSSRESDQVMSFGWGIGALHRLDAATKLPWPRRPPHSISRARVGRAGRQRQPDLGATRRSLPAA